MSVVTKTDAAPDRRHSAESTATRVLVYGLSAALAFIAVVVALRPYSAGMTDTFAFGGDWLWQQALFQVHGQAGPLGTTDHLAYPEGMSGWRLPQMGLLTGVFAWVTVGWLGVPSSAAVIWFVAVCAALNAAGIVFLLRSVLRTRWPVLTGVLAVTIGASIWVTSHQINLALFLVLPVTFAVIHRWDNSLLNRPRYWVLGLFVLALVSPLWWVVVLVLLLPVAVLPALVRRDWQRSGHTLWVWGALLLGMLGQAALFLTLGKGPGNDTTRQAWASNYSGGHLVDLAVGSPAAVEYLPRIGLLTEGASPDSGWGFTSCLAAAIALLAVLTVPPIRSRVGGTTVFLAGATVAVTLFWFMGGLGNLQAGAAVLLGAVSPARAWNRMLLPLALLGAMWGFVLLRRWLADSPSPAVQRVTLGLLTLGLSAMFVADHVVNPTRPYQLVTSPALPMTTFLSDTKDPCPVAQLPNETVPVERIKTTAFKDPLKYTAYAPYTQLPDFYWSGGSYAPGQDPATHPVNAVPVALDAASLDQLAQAGFCAVTYSVAQAQLAQAQDVEIEGRDLAQDLPTPSWQDDTYKVWLLPTP